MNAGNAGDGRPRRPGEDQPTIRVVVVCMGNICRSPMGEAVLRARLDDVGLGGQVRVESAGTGGWHVGDDADPRARAALRRRGYALDHRARQFDRSWFEDADLVLAMDAANHADLLHLAPGADARERVAMMRSFDPALTGRSPGDPDLDVPDPYYGGDSGFDDVLDMLEAAADGVVAHLADHLAAEDGPGAR